MSSQSVLVHNGGPCEEIEEYQKALDQLENNFSDISDTKLVPIEKRLKDIDGELKTRNLDEFTEDLLRNEGRFLMKQRDKILSDENRELYKQTKKAFLDEIERLRNE